MRKFDSVAEERDFTAKMITALVALLGDSAQVTLDADGKIEGFNFTGTEKSVWVTYGRNSDHRFSFSGCWPVSKIIPHKRFTPSDLYSPKADYPSITVSADKSVQQIAGDVKRRFLPVYEAVLTRCQALREQHDNYIRSSNALADEIAKALGVEPTAPYGDRHSPERRNVHLNQNDRVWADVECSSDSASFNIRSVPADKARKLAAFIATL